MVAVLSASTGRGVVLVFQRVISAASDTLSDPEKGMGKCATPTSFSGPRQGRAGQGREGRRGEIEGLPDYLMGSWTMDDGPWSQDDAE